VSVLSCNKSFYSLHKLYFILMALDDRAELMKRANGTYFPEEVFLCF